MLPSAVDVPNSDAPSPPSLMSEETQFCHDSSSDRPGWINDRTTVVAANSAARLLASSASDAPEPVAVAGC